MKKTYQHNGFVLTLEYDGETLFADIEKGEFGGSLAMALDTGAIEGNNWTQTLRVPKSTIEYFLKCEEVFADAYEFSS